MTINHIDQLAQWWETAEQAVVQKGDTVIEYLDDGHHAVYVADTDQDQVYGFYRILARAPKPKPAWHDAVAVIASKDYCERQVWERDTTYENRWYGTAGDRAVTSDLRDVTPLIEAKVTDAQARKALNLYYEASPGENDWPENSVTLMRLAIAAALGLETA